MASGWKEDKQRVDKFEPEIKRTLGEHFIETAPAVRDQKEATDLMVLELKPIRVGCRVRSYKYYTEFGDQFTIRTDRPSGAKTELDKILYDRFVNFLFYGFAGPDDAALVAWFIGNFDVFRATVKHQPWLIDDTRKQKNGDGSSLFLAFKLDYFPQSFVLNQHVYVPVPKEEVATPTVRIESKQKQPKPDMPEQGMLFPPSLRYPD